MKTKNRMITLMEIAIVLCSVFLVALPGMVIAADQNQEMQKISASEITTSSEDDYALGIYGNANEDDTIDMRDLTYVKLIFFGKKPETELADAKYDGKINPLDFIQIKLIIVGKEKELTILQYICPKYGDVLTEVPVTVNMPIERIVSIQGTYGAEALCAFGAQDKIVGVDQSAKKAGELKTFLEDKPSVGKASNWDMEKILERNPDIVLGYCYPSYFRSKNAEVLSAAGIPLVWIDFYIMEKYSREIKNLGWMLNKQERAEELIDFEQQHISLIKERVEDLKDEHKTRVYYAGYTYYYGVPTHTAGKGKVSHNKIELCGGINIFADITGSKVVDPEEVIERNPQVIYAFTSSGASTGALGYGITDTDPAEKVRRDTIMNYPGWDQIDAVKNGRVYTISANAQSTHSSVILSYMAKYFYPELFEDIDPVDIHREWIETFLGIEYKGVYAYPLP